MHTPVLRGRRGRAERSEPDCRGAGFSWLCDLRDQKTADFSGPPFLHLQNGNDGHCCLGWWGNLGN